MKTSSAKQKGRKLQQWVCQQISELLDIPWGSEDENLIQSRPMGQSGNDIILRGVALTYFPFSTECKNTEKWDIHGTIKQVKANQKEGTDWLVVMKRNNEKPVVILDAERFFDIYSSYYLVGRK
jgi:hypothetical protein